MSKNTPHNPIDHDDAPAEPRHTLAEIEAMIADLPDDERLPAELQSDARAHLAITAQQIIDQHPDMTVGELRNLQRLIVPEPIGHPVQLPIDDLFRQMEPAAREGWARLTTVALMRGLTRNLLTPWNEPTGEWPRRAFSWDNDGSVVHLTFDEPVHGATAAETQAAHDTAARITVWTAPVLRVLLATYYRNRNRSIRGQLTISTNEILDWWNKGTEKGYRAEDKDHVNESLRILSYLVIEAGNYEAMPNGTGGKSKRQRYNLPPMQHLLTANRIRANGRNITWDIRLGEPMLMMIDHLHDQIVAIQEGSARPDARSPYVTRLDAVLPLEARARPAVFERHGMMIGDLLRMIDVNPDDIDPRDRTWWRRQLPVWLDQAMCIGSWSTVGSDKLPSRWDRLMTTRLRIHIAKAPKAIEAMLNAE